MVIEWGGALAPETVGIWLLFLLVGVVGHEALHLLAFLSFGEVPRVRASIKYLGVGFEPTKALPRWQVAVASLAPIVWLVAGAWGFSQTVEFPIDWRLAAGAGLFVLGAMPSPGDIYTLLLYHPEAASPEVAADG